MKILNLFLVVGLLSFWVTGLTGCTVRTYSLTKDRIDQDLTGNRGYIQGNAPAETAERKLKRTTQVIEIEFGPKAKPGKAKKEAVQPESILTPEVVPSETIVSETAPISAPVGKMQEYKVKKGDTLQKISHAFYGTTKKWTKIYNANKDKMKGPDKIYPGQTINIPVEELKEPKENLK